MKGNIVKGFWMWNDQSYLRIRRTISPKCSLAMLARVATHDALCTVHAPHVNVPTKAVGKPVFIFRTRSGHEQQWCLFSFIFFLMIQSFCSYRNTMV